MKLRTFSVCLPGLAALLSGCSGSSAPSATAGAPVTTQSIGSLTTRIVGTSQPPVTSSAASFGANVTGIAGALIDQLTLHPYGAPTLRDTRIAFTSDRDGNREVYTMDIEGGTPIRLTNALSFDDSPAWSPDGSKIAFISGRDGAYDVYVMNANGSSPLRLTNDLAYDAAPQWSPDGSKIAFVSGRDGNNEIYVMNADGSSPTRLTNNAANEADPVWSPNGAKIAFASDRDGNHEIYSMNANGTNQRRLTADPGEDIYPAWSPDGSRLAFCTTRDGYPQIYTMAENGTALSRVTNGGTDNRKSAWSPDGMRLIFNTFRDGNSEIYSVAWSGGVETNLSRLPNGDFDPSWSGYLPRAPKTLVGPGGAISATAAGIFVGQRDSAVTSVVAFETTTPASRSAARIVAQTAPYNEQGSNLIFSITTSAGLEKLWFVNGGYNDIPGQVQNPQLASGTTGALVSFSASQGTVTSVLPYAANRSASLKPMRVGSLVTYARSFSAVFDGSGKNLAPGGAKSVTLDEKTGKLVRFE